MESAPVFLRGRAENVRFFHSLESLNCGIAIGNEFSKFWREQFSQLQRECSSLKERNICLLTARRTPFLQHFISKMFSASSHLDIVLLTRMIFFPRRKCVVNTGTFGPGAEWSVKEDELKIRCSPTDGAKRGIRVRPLHAWVTHFHSVTVYAALRGINGHCFTDEFYCVWTSADLYP